MCSKSQKVTKVCKEHPSLANLGVIPTSLSLFNLPTCVHCMCQQMGVCWVKLTEIRFVEQDCCLLGAPFPQSDAKETRLPPHNPCCSFCSSFTSPAFSFHEISNHCHSQGLGKMNPSLSNQIIDWMQGGGAPTNWITRKGGGEEINVRSSLVSLTQASHYLILGPGTLALIRADSPGKTETRRTETSPS